MKKYFWFLVLIVLASSLFSQQIEYAYPRKSYLEELSQPSRTLRENAPEIIASGNVNYIIGYAPIIVAPNISLSNFSANVEGMKIYFTNNFNSDQDILELSQNFAGVTETYDQTTGILVLEGSHDAAFWENVCRHVQYRNSSNTPIQNLRDVTFTLISAIFIPSTGHYYEFISNYGVSWSDSKSSADLASYYGLQGYLATVTSAEENFFITTELGGVGWIGGSDHEEHDTWKWVAGPESGTEYWDGRYPSHSTLPGSPINGMYSNWNNLEPNQHFGDNNPEMWEDYCHMIYNPSVGTIGSWNDLPDAGTTGNFTPYGYVVEYGGMINDPEVNLYSTVTVTVSDIIVNEILPSAGGELEIDETETIYFLVDVFGLNAPLSYSWKLDGVEVYTNYYYDFTTDYNSAGFYQVYLHIEENDGSELNYYWDITVNDVDQNIVVNEILPATGGNITINELESIAFSIDAYDPDGNDLEYIWKLNSAEVSTTNSYDFITDYTSAGTYIITLDISDNPTSSMNYVWNITVNDVDQNIVVNEILPTTGGNITINELESIAFSIDAYDPDGNELEYLWKLDEIDVSSTSSYDFTTDYASAGAYVVSLNVMDNFSRNSINYIWDVTVNDVDQEIVVNDILPNAGGSIVIDELETIMFSIDAYDPDGNELEYLWNLDSDEVSATSSYDFITDYTSAGSYIITLDVRDNFSRSSLNYTWDITVNDIDQNIVVNEILPSAGGSVTINELESIAFSIDAYDPDGNDLEYLWKLDETEVSTTSSYDFITDYTSAGSYIITLDVRDNFSRSSLNYIWDITVNDVDQNIVVNEILPSAGGSIIINELESVAFSIDAYDPNGNSLNYSWRLDGSEVSATDSYNFITDYSSNGSYIITLDVTDNFSRSSLNYLWDITVIDVDQSIVINEILPSAGGSVIVNELESVTFSIDAYDPDGNDLGYIWKLDEAEVSTTSTYDFITDYTSAGTYVVSLNVMDNFSRNSINYIWDVTVNDVDQNIVVNEILPSAGGELEINEMESIAFSIDAYDPDGNELEYIWKLDEAEVSSTSFYDFTTDYSSAGSHIVSLAVTDNFSRSFLNYSWNITVNDVDQGIVVNEIMPDPGNLLIQGGESIDFFIDAYDPDGNALDYNWELNGRTVSTTNLYRFATDIHTSGVFDLELFITDNFLDSYLRFDWEITVLYGGLNIIVTDLNPAPGNLEIIETDEINFVIDAYANNGDNLTYDWQIEGDVVSTTSTYHFETDFTSAGNYVLILRVEDEQFDDTVLNFVWNISVLENDQPIVINDIQPEPGEVIIDESDEVYFLIDAYDPDGNTLEYNWDLNGVEVSTTSSYNFTTDENSAGAYVVTLAVTDNFSRNSLIYAWDITVNDIDQGIVVNEILPSAGGILEIMELESIAFSIDAYDPNGNNLQFSWRKDGNEVSTTDSYDFTTDENSAGFYIITLDLTDNFSRNSLTYTWNITVNDITVSSEDEIFDDERAILTIYNVKGQRIETVYLTSGLRNFDWNQRKLGSGVYFYKLKTKTQSKIKKMVLLK